MIAENNLEAWEYLYDKYAAAMYGIICKLTDDRTLSEEIFIGAFLQLKEKQILSKTTHPICVCLLRHTHIFAKQELTNRGINSTNKVEESSLINMFCSQHLTAKDAAVKLNITEQEVRRKLRLEFLELRSQS